jgi:hypothetical protein
MALRFAADVAVTNGQVFQYRFHIPALMEIESITVNDPQGPRPARWSRGQTDVVTVFLATATFNSRQILISGSMPIPPNGKFALPGFRLDGASDESFQSFVLRRPEVRVEINEPPQRIAESELPALAVEAQNRGTLDPVLFSKRRLVSALRTTEGFQSVVLKITPNQPRLDVDQLTTLNRLNDDWQATVDFNCQIADGLVDTFRLDLPPNWTGPFAVAPPMPFTIDEITGENRRQLVLRPDHPIGSTKRPTDLHLHIAGPLTVAADQRPTAPDVRLAETRQASYFLLPRGSESQQMSWDTPGLVFKPLPSELAAWAPDLKSYRSYQLVGAQGRASLRSVERNTQNPQVRSTDIAYSWRNDGESIGIAAFDLEPSGAENCELQRPPQSQLIQAQLDSAPAQLSAAGNNRWNVWLRDNKLPRNLEIIFKIHGNITSDALEKFAAPHIADWPVERTLWTIIAPESAGMGVMSEGTPISALRHARSRLEATSALLDSAASLLLDESTADVANWYVPWARRFAAFRAELVRAGSQAPSIDQSRAATAEIAALDEEHARLIRRLGIAGASKTTAPQPAAEKNALEQLVATDGSTNNISYASVRGQGNQLTIDYRRPIPWGIGARRWVASLIALSSLAIMLAGWRGYFPVNRLALRPEIVGAAIGAVWWLWLWPSAIGLLVIAVCMGSVLARRSNRYRTAVLVASAVASSPESFRG